MSCDSDGVRDCELRVAGGSETERVRDGDRQGRERERAAPINTQKEELDGGGRRRRAEEEVEQRKVEVGGARVCGGGRDMYTLVGLAHDILLLLVPNFRLLLFSRGPPHSKGFNSDWKRGPLTCPSLQMDLLPIPFPRISSSDPIRSLTLAVSLLAIRNYEGGVVGVGARRVGRGSQYDGDEQPRPN